MNAFNDAFKEYLKLRAIKANTKPINFSDNVFFTIYIQNNGDKIIKLISGNIYYFDQEDVSDEVSVYITTIIKPNETIKYDTHPLPKNIKRAEIRDRDGNNNFRYRYDYPD